MQNLLKKLLNDLQNLERARQRQYDWYKQEDQLNQQQTHQNQQNWQTQVEQRYLSSAQARLDKYILDRSRLKNQYKTDNS